MSQETDLSSSGEGEVDSLKAKNAELSKQLDDMSSEVAVANCVKESLVELERRNADLQAELTTLQSLLNESVQETNSSKTKYEHEIARIKAVLGQLQQENRELRINQGQTQASNSAANEAGGGDKDAFNAFSDATKSLSRKMKTNFASAVTNLVPVKSPTSEDIPAGLMPASEDLAAGQRQAAQDTQLLKSIVEPLEEQIGALKQKLRDTDVLLVESEKRQAKSILGIETLVNWISGQTSLDQALSDLQERQTELLSFAELKSADETGGGRDGAVSQLHLSALTTRVAILTNQIGAARSELANQTELANRALGNSEELRRQSAAWASLNAKLKARHLAQLYNVSAVLTEEQKGQIKEDIKSEDPESGDGPSQKTVNGVEDESPVLINRTEWDNLNRELTRIHGLLGIGAEEKLVGGSQVVKLQEELARVTKQCEVHAKNEERLRDELVKESQVRQTVESEWNNKADQHKSETDTLSAQLQKSEEILESLKMSYTTNYKATRKDLAKLTTEREEIVRELKRLQDENDNLVGKHSAKSAEMEAEGINLPDNMDEIQFTLLKMRDDLIKAKVAKEALEERLASEVSFLKTQLQAEQQAKESVEDQLSGENDQLKEKIFVLESCKSELEAEQKRSKEFEETQTKDRRVNANLQRQMESYILEKRQMETQLSEKAARIKNLQQELDNSVAVQTDFVRLSQSLQMELEKIRQSEKEVRWQHEDDVKDCQGCKTLFAGGSRRNKHHCRHCGRVFCAECLQKSVASGPNGRPARVCDVCHTLLVQNSAPYFSTEPPASKG